MANRFIDTRFFKSPFVRSMKAPSKLLYTYIICECSAAGIWEKDLEAASLYTGVDQTEDEFRLFVETGRAIEISEGRIFFPDFILHQYPSGLQRNNPAHRNVISELLKLNLLSEDTEGALKPLQRSFKAPQVMVMVKEKVMGTEKGTVNAREKKFTAPELIDVQNFMDELNVKAGRPWTDAATGTEAKAFWNYYESNGWKVGRNPMKKWEAAARNWMNNAHKFKSNGNGTAKNNGSQRGSKADPADVFDLFRAKYGTPNPVDSETPEG